MIYDALILHNNEKVYVKICEQCTTIYDSYKITKYSDMKAILQKIKKISPSYCAIHNRTIFSMINEWRCHNLIYKLGLFKTRTKDVDMQYPLNVIYDLIYFIISPLYI